VDEQREITLQPEPRDGGEKAVIEQAMAWILRLASGEATVADAEALRQWRAQSPLHRQAFAEAKLLWETLDPATREITQKTRSSGGGDVPARYSRPMGRRALIGGALAASFAAAGYIGSKPPFRLWPSVSELSADYRTTTGEQRQLALADDITLVLNTQTSIGVRSIAPGARAIELISGEAAITAKAGFASFDVLAASGRTSAAIGRFDVRREGATVCVTCFDGIVQVERDGQSVSVPPGHQTTYDSSGLGKIVPIDVGVVSAWQQGQLVFRHEPLSRVVEEINRYRPGRIILLNERLGERDVVATFHLNRIHDAVEHLARTFGARTRSLPGGVVLLS
jgi:transmembrane sensor